MGIQEGNSSGRGKKNEQDWTRDIQTNSLMI